MYGNKNSRTILGEIMEPFLSDMFLPNLPVIDLDLVQYLGEHRDPYFRERVEDVVDQCRFLVVPDEGVFIAEQVTSVPKKPCG